MKVTHERTGRAQWFTGLILFVLMLSWGGYQLWLLQQPLPIHKVTFNPACDLRVGACESILADGARVSFAIQPRAIPLAAALQLAVNVSGLDVDAVTVDLSGVDMNMPPNRVKLQQTGNGQFNGKGILSFCSRNEMEWEAVIELAAGSRRIHVAYRFITSKAGS